MNRDALLQFYDIPGEYGISFFHDILAFSGLVFLSSKDLFALIIGIGEANNGKNTKNDAGDPSYAIGTGQIIDKCYCRTSQYHCSHSPHIYETEYRTIVFIAKRCCCDNRGGYCSAADTNGEQNCHDIHCCSVSNES